MNRSIIFILLLVSCASGRRIEPCKFVIDIWDHDYSMAYTRHYQLSMDSLLVGETGGIEGDDSTILLKREVSQSDTELLCANLQTFPFESIGEKYDNPLIDDGDIKRIRLTYNNRTKTIDVKNVYQKDVAQIIDLVNRILRDKFLIDYVER